jgi:signal transduction histidine kinase
MAIDWFCRRFEGDYPHIHIDKTLLLEEPDLPDALKIVIFRIIQEALNNVAKHSGVNSVTLRLGKENGAIEMKIRDNGRGFDVAEARESARISACVGLSSMTERARLSGGTLEIHSGETGTEIRVVWPV